MALNLLDITSNNNDLTNVDATEYTSDFPFAQSTEAVDLSGSSQYLYAADSTSLSITGDLTIEGWVKLDVVNQSRNFVAKRNPTTNQRSYGLGFSDNATGSQLSFVASSDGTLNDGNVLTTGSGISDTNWHHVAVTWDASAHSAQFYVDGSAFEAAKDTTITSIYDSTASLDIGSQADSRVNTLNGKVDDMRIWNVVRTTDEINNNKGVELVGNESGLVAYWPYETLGANYSDTFTEVITLSEVFSRQATFNRTFSEIITVVESFNRAFYKTFTETISVVETFSKKLNDVLVTIWTTVRKTVASWTKGTKPTSSWTKTE